LTANVALVTRTASGQVSDWLQGGQRVETTVGRIFFRRAGGSGPPILFLHGYPSSSFDFRQVLDRIPGRASVLLDFLGFGLSDKPRPHRYSIFEQADLVEQVLATDDIDTVDVVAHDMGTSVATELMARDQAGELPFQLRRVVLCNAGIIVARTSLRPVQRALLSPAGGLVARLANRPMFTREFARLFSDGHPLGPAEAAAQWALISHGDGHRIAHLLCAYVRERVTHADRWHGAIRDWAKPVGLLWGGLRDPVATPHVLAGLRELRPGADVIELPGLGHYPQLEDPDAFTTAMLSLLEG
jgi:pimeloyl-ACP methyl ester carboxylesterase